MSSSHPLEIATAYQNVNGKNIVLSIENFLDPPGEGDNPLQYHSGKSRFKVAIIDATGNSTLAVVANISAKSVPHFLTVANHLNGLNMDRRLYMSDMFANFPNMKEKPFLNNTTVWDSKVRYSRWKVRENGDMEAYHLVVKLNPSSPFPWRFSILNGFVSPSSVSENGNFRQATDKELRDIKRATIEIGSESMSLILDRMQTTFQNFQSLCFSENYMRAKMEAERIRENA